MFTDSSRQAVLCLIGGLLIKFGMGMATVWSTVNVYFFSYFQDHGEHITPTTNSNILLYLFLPMCISIVSANILAKAIGYLTSIRLCAILFLISPAIAINIHPSLTLFIIFWLIVPLCCLCLGSIPVISCLWRQFSTHLNIVSALALIAYSLGMIFWNILFLYLINPDNQQAQIGENEMPYFSPTVSERVVRASNICYGLAGACNVLGSFLVRKESQSAQDTSAIQVDLKRSRSQSIIEAQQLPKYDRMVSELVNIEESSPSLWAHFRDRRFQLILAICLLLPTYGIYLWLNIKLIFMSVINDDHFLSYCSALTTLSALIGAPLWAYLADKISFKKTLLILVATDVIVKSLGLFCQQKWNLALLFLLLGVIDKGTFTIIGPGLVQMFGVEVATELIPFKGLAVFLGFLVVPVMQKCFFDILSYRLMLALFVVLDGIALGLAILLYFIYQSTPLYSQEKGQKQQQLKEMMIPTTEATKGT